jgi:multidrug efflux pump subunit AcrB
MNFYEKLIRNHPLANIAFAVVLAIGALAYLTMPREQDPEINFNWVMVTAVLPGASAEDVEKRVTKPLEDAIKGVADIRFVMSSSRENVVSMLVRFREIDERIFDKRINDLRREIQNKAKSELPPEAKDPQIIEITTSNGFPTAMVLVTGQAADELLRALATSSRTTSSAWPAWTRSSPPACATRSCRWKFDPVALANRGLTAADVADSVNAWFRDTFAGKVETAGERGRTAWLVRVVGQTADPELIASIPLGGAVAGGARREPVPLGQVAEVSRGRATAGSLASYQGRGAVILAVTKKSRTNTLQLVERLNGYIAAQNPRLPPRACSCNCSTTRPCRRARPSRPWSAMPCRAWCWCWRSAGCSSARA